MKLRYTIPVGARTFLSAQRRSATPVAERNVRAPGVRAFTMVEVAISLAVIGFALVAIIGILPAGLNVQKENREETIVNQDVSIWMDAIRSGAEGMDYLTNYVDAIKITVTEYDVNSGVELSRIAYTNTLTLPVGEELYNGARIVGLLTTPKYQPSGSGTFYSNSVVAYVRAISGGATEKPPQDNTTVLDSGFSYRLTSEVVPFFSSEADNFDYAAFRYNSSGSDSLALYMQSLAENMHDIRLLFEWPLRPPFDFNAVPPVLPNKVGNSRQSFRRMIGGIPTNAANRLYFIQPGRFEKGGF